MATETVTVIEMGAEELRKEYPPSHIRPRASEGHEAIGLAVGRGLVWAPCFDHRGPTCVAGARIRGAMISHLMKPRLWHTRDGALCVVREA
jgi:hypothetical protein